MGKVFVLGAGASREYNSVTGWKVPLDKDFWGTTGQIIAEDVRKGNLGPRTEDGRHLDFTKIIHELKEWYGVQEIGDLNRYGLEKVFSDIEENHPVKLPNFIRLLEWILFYIIRGINQEHAPTHYTFVKRMLQLDDCIITFNYDIIIDQVLWNISAEDGNKIYWHPASGYGIPFNGYTNQNANDNTVHPLEYANSNVKIYKLHGSLGWIDVESNFPILYLSKTTEGNLRLAQKGYLKKQIFIVPPIRNKEFPEWIEKLWIDAEDSLMKADEVNFIGYSFPETDTMAINMFKRACRGKLIRIILPVAYLESDHSRLSEILDNPQMIPMKFSTWCL